MDWKSAAVGMVKATAWPTLVAIIFFQLRPQIRSLLGRLVKASGYGIEMTFGEQLAKVEELTESAQRREPEMAFDAALVERPTLTLPKTLPPYTRPRYIVEEVWMWVRGCLDADASSRGINPNEYAFASVLARRLGLSQPLLDALDGLERIRNGITQTPVPDLSLEDAQHFRTAAEHLVAKF